MLVITAEAPLRPEPLGEGLKRAEDGNHQYTRVSYDVFQHTCEENNTKKPFYTIPPRKSYFYARKTVRKSSLLRTVLVFEFRTL